MADTYSDLEEDDACDETFNRATEHVKTLLPRIPPHKLLEIYAFYKQATVGPCNIPKPRFYELKAREKYDAWSKLHNITAEQAKNEYVRVITELDPDFPSNEEKTEGWVTVSTLLNTDTAISDYDKTIFDFCKENNLPEMVRILKANGKLLGSKDDNGLGLIHWAADRGNLEILVYLVENKADVNMTDNEGQTALHYAASCDYLACVEYLLNAGADCHLCDNDGLRPVDLATDSNILKLLKEFM